MVLYATDQLPEHISAYILVGVPNWGGAHQRVPNSMIRAIGISDPPLRLVQDMIEPQLIVNPILPRFMIPFLRPIGPRTDTYRARF